MESDSVSALSNDSMRVTMGRRLFEAGYPIHRMCYTTGYAAVMEYGDIYMSGIDFARKGSFDNANRGSMRQR